MKSFTAKAVKLLALYAQAASAKTRTSVVISRNGKG
jgi:hypothetical protein